MKSYLSIAPIMFNLSDDEFISFYKKISSFEHVKDVHIGEVVCVKRAKKIEVYQEAISILKNANKKVFISTPALIMDKSDNKYLKKIIGEEGALIEINEMTAFALNKSNDFSIGSFINIYNEASAAYFDEKSPIKISLPVEIGLSQIKEISKNIKSPLEVIVFGKLPLSLSARCYMAKHYKKNKQNCMMVCKDHKEGIGLKTLDNKNILCVNGTMVMSGKTYFLKEEEIKKLQENNVSSFKIFPTQDLTFKAIEYYSDILDRKDNNDFMNLDSFNDYFYS